MRPPLLQIYSEQAIWRSRQGALEWLEGNGEGYPRSWAQEEANTKLRGYVLYDSHDFEAPPIAGYEALEREGLVVRHNAETRNGEERIRFTLLKPSS